ncbi:MAG: hypothetical protein EOP83_04715 [Verrucomicrobiaceae bacterium]|nr:MAG: hypothetical protein EOP83_04715 [Verrucomicrobiaceae bacterium]
MPNVDDIIAFENGEMDHDQMVEFFQGLIDSGMAWRLQGSYGRTAAQLIDSGYCEDRSHTRS